MLYHKPHVRTECMFGFNPDTGCTKCFSNKFWNGSYKYVDHSDMAENWYPADFQLTFTGNRCTEIQGLYAKSFLPFY